jgi:hypothetical protein
MGKSMSDEWNKSQKRKQWLHSHRSYRFKKPDGTEYIDRRQHTAAKIRKMT